MFEPGSLSLSFLVFAVCTVIVVGVIAGLVRYHSRKHAHH